MEIDYIAIGKRIRALRKEKHWTQDNLSDAANISKTHMSHIETGTTKLSLPVIIDIANALDTTVDYLLGANVQSSAPILKQEIADLLDECSPRELYTMMETMRFVRKMTDGFYDKDSLRRIN